MDNVIIFYVGAMSGYGKQKAEEQKLENDRNGDETQSGFRLALLQNTQEINRMPLAEPYLWRFSLAVLYGVEEVMYTPATSKGTGSEARGEGWVRGHLIEIISKPPVAKRARGIFLVPHPSD